MSEYTFTVGITRSLRKSLTTHFEDVPALSRMVEKMTDEEIFALSAHLLEFFVSRKRK